MRLFVSGLLVGIIFSHALTILFSYADQSDKFVLSRHEMAQQEGRRVSRSTICNDCMDDMGKVLYDISYLSSALADVQESLLDAVYGYAKKKKTGFLAYASREQLREYYLNLQVVHEKINNVIISTDGLIEISNT